MALGRLFLRPMAIKLPSFRIKTIIIILIIFIVAAVAAAPSYYFYKQYQKVQTLLKNPTEAGKIEIKELMKKVSKLMDLPKGEDPVVAVVTDKEKLKDQPFFNKAEIGDRVLIFSNAKKAILYREKANKIIEVAPIDLNAQQVSSSSAQASPLPSASPAALVKIVLRNGTATSGLTSKLEADLKKELPRYQVITRENAALDSYEKTTLVALNENGKKEAEALAKYLNITVSDLPSGEKEPVGADILVILGKDRI